jgi:hypothetical protein
MFGNRMLPDETAATQPVHADAMTSVLIQGGYMPTAIEGRIKDGARSPAYSAPHPRCPVASGRLAGGADNQP